MKMTSCLLVSLFFILTLSPSFGEEDIPPLTLHESIEIALQRSPTVKAAKAAIKEAEFRRRAAISDFLPQVSTQYSYTRLDEEPAFSIPSMGIRTTVGNRDVYDWTSTVTQPIFTGGALINSYLLAKLGVDTAKVELEMTRLDLILQVKEAYYGVLKAEKFLEVAEQAVRQLESHHKVAKAFFDVGMIPKNDLLQVEVQLAQTRQDLIKAQNGLAVARAVFNTLLRRLLDEEVKLVEVLQYRPIQVDLEAYTEEAYRKRPEIKAAELGIKSAKRGVGLAASGLFPQVSVLYNYERQGDDPSVSGSRYKPDEDSWNVMALAQWNIWDWGKTWWGVGENKAKVFQAECALQEAKDGVRLEVKEAYLNLKEAEKKIRVAEKAVSQADENFRINEERYKGQVATSTDVLDALTLLTQARTNYHAALSDYNIARARLKRAIGER
ncbi:MAG: TolC family protein [Deltaproteobacteria bacterium]|nr:TolC family protein [Deltaproteobacteria bacterium]